MNRFLVLLIVLALVLGLVAAKGPKNKKQNNGRNREAGRRGGRANTTSPEAAGGEWSECVPKKGDCGRGVKTCTGEECLSETAECRVKCADTAAETVEETVVEGAEMITEAPTRRGGGRGKGQKPEKTPGKGRGDKGQRGGRKPNKPEKPAKNNTECQYVRATFTECNPETNRMNKTRMLKEGSPAECALMLTDVVRCDRKEMRKENKRCNYTMGVFGPCNVTTHRRVGVETLVDPSMESEQCRLTRPVQERCPALDCKYNWEESECNAETNMITLTGSLVNVEGAPEACETVLTKELKCKEGHAGRCMLGEWNAYGECVDGIQSRTREVKKGGGACQRLTVEYATCE